MIRHSPCSPRSDTLFLDTTLFRVEEAGLVRAGGVGAELHAGLGDDRRRRGLRALAVPGLEVERLLLLHVLVGEGVESAAGELRAQRFVDPLPCAAHAGAADQVVRAAGREVRCQYFMSMEVEVASNKKKPKK